MKIEQYLDKSGHVESMRITTGKPLGIIVETKSKGVYFHGQSDVQFTEINMYEKKHLLGKELRFSCGNNGRHSRVDEEEGFEQKDSNEFMAIQKNGQTILGIRKYSGLRRLQVYDIFEGHLRPVVSVGSDGEIRVQKDYENNLQVTEHPSWLKERPGRHVYTTQSDDFSL